MNSLGIYIHVPFCEKKCPYCNFYSLKSNEIDKIKFTDKTIFEIKKWGIYLKDNIVDSIYFGGGTPSLLGLEKILKIINEIKKNFNVIDPEITVEINPADYSLIDFEKLKFNGVNRVSVGAQCLDDIGLKMLGRRHTVKDILDTYNQIKLAKINNISFDLIVGFPNQTKNDIQTFLDFYKENKLSHLSSYILKVEKDTIYGKSNLNFADDELCSEFYIYISEYMKKLGYNHYEISNFALPGKESRHNLKYWNLDNYLGIGPSAHSLINGKRFFYEDNLNDFIIFSKISDEGICSAKEEYAMLRLRLSSGLKNNAYKEKFGEGIPKDFFEKARKFEKYGFIETDENSIALTEKGFLLSNKIISELIF